jgi:U3 small nucleolar RNA-associated protein 18
MRKRQNRDVDDASTRRKRRREKEKKSEEETFGDDDVTTMRQLEEEAELESLVFADTLHASSVAEHGTEGIQFMIDAAISESKGTAGGESDQAEQEEHVVDQDDQDVSVAWHDEEDDKELVNIGKANQEYGAHRKKKLRRHVDEHVVSGRVFERRLRQQFERANVAAGDLSWAQIQKDDHDDRSRDSDDDDDNDADSGNDDDDDVGVLLGSTSALVSRRSAVLAPSALDVTRQRDANQSDVSKSALSAAEFHCNGQLMLTASLDRSLKVFRIDGKHNPKVQGVVFRDMPVTSAHFTADGEQIYCSGKRPFTYTFDMGSARVIRNGPLRGRTERTLERTFVSPDNRYIAALGDDGYVLLVSRRTKQCVGSLKMNAPGECAGFTSDGATLFTSSRDGDIYQWNMATQRCVRVFQDDGALRTTSLAVSPNGRTLATGTRSGVINVYDATAFAALGTYERPAPAKALMNFTTAVTALRFNHSSEMLAAASAKLENQFKVFHARALTGFANWPTSRTPLNTVTAFDFSPHSGFLTIGNRKGRALLYRLNHFESS